MSITVIAKDRILARMLLLEAKRQGFSTQADNNLPPLFLAVLEQGDTAPEVPAGALSVAFTAKPLHDLPYDAVLPLPFSVRDFEQTLHLLLHAAPRVIQSRNGKLFLGGRAIPLSPTEQRLFDLLYHNRHRVVTAAELEAVLTSTGGGALSVFLYRLRRKLSCDGITRIRTVRGVGFQWTEGQNER